MEIYPSCGTVGNQPGRYENVKFALMVCALFHIHQFIHIIYNLLKLRPDLQLFCIAYSCSLVFLCNKWLHS